MDVNDNPNENDYSIDSLQVNNYRKKMARRLDMATGFGLDDVLPQASAEIRLAGAGVDGGRVLFPKVL